MVSQFPFPHDEGLGFADAGVRKGYYEDNGEDALIMWKGKL